MLLIFHDDNHFCVLTLGGFNCGVNSCMVSQDTFIAASVKLIGIEGGGDLALMWQEQPTSYSHEVVGNERARLYSVL